MTDSPDDLMGALLDAAARVLAKHDPGECAPCLEPACVAARAPGRCLPYRIADEVLGTWSNRVHAAPLRVVDPEEVDVINRLEPGQSVITGVPLVVVKANGEQTYHRSGIRVVRAAGHPWWCVMGSCRGAGAYGGRHIGEPDQVAHVWITLMQAEGEQPMIALTDLSVEAHQAATVTVPAAFAGRLGRALQVIDQRLTASDQPGRSRTPPADIDI
jgi:hypothetical protein